MDNHSEGIKTVVDVASVGTILGTIIGYLPAVAAFVSIVWGLIRIYETQTVQDLLKKWKS